MLFSLDWLLQLCPAGRDADRIADALTSRGLTVDSVAPRGEDHVLDVDIPANRPDCLGHLGLARELASAFAVPLAESAPSPGAEGTPTRDAVRVEIVDPDLCPRYTAGIVRDVRVGPSPAWVVRRLEACGLRSVSNVVDASNLVMLELGQPIHFFDLERLGGGTATPLVRIRRAATGESLRTLDGTERKLEDDMLVIADSDRAVALAGVIGGSETEIGSATRHVLVEAAHFEPRSVRSTSRRLAARTDASFRFERGVDPDAPLAAQVLAARLLNELCGGRPAPGIVDAYPHPAEARSLTVRQSELERLLGFTPEGSRILAALGSLQLAPEDAGGGALRVTVPSWRRDLDREVDLVEEVARHLGYDDIPAAEESVTAHVDAAPHCLEDRARDVLSHRGFREAIGYSMIGGDEDARFVSDGTPQALVLSNPIAEPLASLRRSILPGLLRAVDLNLRRGVDDVRLFEVGRVFVGGSGGSAPDEPRRAGVAWTGAGQPAHWSGPRREVDLHDVIGLGDHVLRSLRPGATWSRHPGARPAFHPGRSLHWKDQQGRELGWGGALHPEVQESLDSEVMLLELDLDAMQLIPASPPRQRPIPRVPAVIRDLSLVVTRRLAYSAIVDVLESVDPPAPARFDAVDRYEGAPLASGEAALTVRVTLSPVERTLTDEATERYRDLLIEALARDLGVRIRS